MNKCFSIFIAGFIAMLNGCAVEQGPQAAVVTAQTDVVADSMGHDDHHYFAGHMPDALVDGVIATMDRTPFAAELVAQLFAYGEDNPDDARPWMLLAGDAMRAQDWTRAADSYWRAIDSDPVVKTFPKVLEELIFIASLPAARGELARKLIEREYGAEAMPALDVALTTMHSEGSREGAFWLGELRKAIQG